MYSFYFSSHPSLPFGPNIIGNISFWTRACSSALFIDYFSNFFNKVLLNTIEGHQVFCFVPIVQYHPKTVAEILDMEGYSDATYNINMNSLHASNIGYFPRDSGRIQHFSEIYDRHSKLFFFNISIFLMFMIYIETNFSNWNWHWDDVLLRFWF